MEMLPRWQVVTLRCWLSTSEIGCAAWRTQSKKLPMWLTIASSLPTRSGPVEIVEVVELELLARQRVVGQVFDRLAVDRAAVDEDPAFGAGEHDAVAAVVDARSSRRRWDSDSVAPKSTATL